MRLHDQGNAPLQPSQGATFGAGTTYQRRTPMPQRLVDTFRCTRPAIERFADDMLPGGKPAEKKQA
jgi:hypothetical protein